MLTFQTSNTKDVVKAKNLIDQESTPFPTLIKVSAIEKTEDLNFPQRYPVLTRVLWKIMLRS